MKGGVHECERLWSSDGAQKGSFCSENGPVFLKP